MATIEVNSKDDIAMLTTDTSAISSTANSKAHTFRSTDADLHSNVTGGRPDTIHFLSPASTDARTEYEGDIDYRQFYVSHLFEQEPDSPKGGGVDTSSSESSIPCEENMLQRTVAIVKPEALCYKDAVLRAVNESGLKIINERTVHLTPEQVSEIYEKYYGTPAFPHMVVTVSASPLLVLSLQAVNAVEKWKSIIGPMGTLRQEWFFPRSISTRFGYVGDYPNTLHASEGANEARTENRYFFPRDILEPLPSTQEKVKDYITTFVKPTLLDGLYEIVQKKPMDPVIYLAEWLLLHNPFKPKMDNNIALVPT